MTYEIKNKTVIITGGASGIGASVVRKLISEDAKFVSVLDVDEAAGISLQNELNSKYDFERIKFIKCDVSDDQQLLGAFQKTLEESSSIDIVINNAAIMNDSLNVYKKAIEINFTALVTSTLKALEIMRKDTGGNGGVVINISSVAALCQNAMLPIYYATKSAVLQFSNCLGTAEYYSRTGVRIITICFGATNTPLLTTAKMGTFDKEYEGLLLELLKTFSIQSAESAALGVIEACKRGESGSTWLSIQDEPVKDITSTVKQAYSILTAQVFY